MPDQDLGTAKGKIDIDSSGAVRGVGEANAAIDTIDGHASRAGGSLGLLSKAMLGVGAAGVAGFGLAVKHASDFEATLSGVEAVTGATGKEMDAMRKKALKLGADTVFSANDAAAAMEELAKAGLSVDDILNGAADATVALAAAGGIDLPTAATIAANAMNQFGLSASDLPHVADLIAGAANASAIDVNDFGLAMQQAGATANLIGLDFDDLALAITAMGNAGIKGSDAGTSLKTFLQNLQPVTQKQIDLFYDLGLATEENATSANTLGNAFFDANGQIKSMSEISGILNTALAGMSDAQKTATLETIFGTDAIRAAAVISNTGADGMDALSASMGGLTAADVAAKRMDNFAGSMEQLKGSLDTALITIGELLLPYLREIADRLTDAVNAFNNLSPTAQKTIAIIAGGASAFLLMAGSIGLMSHAMGIAGGPMATMGALFAKLGMGIVSALGPWGLLIIAVAALAAGFVYLYTHSERFREIVDAIVDSVVKFGKAVARWFENTIIPAVQEFADFFTKNILPKIKAFVNGAIKIIGGIVDWITGTAVPVITKAWDKVVEVAVAAWKWFDKNVISTIEAFVELAVAIFDKLRAFFEEVLLPAIQRTMDIIVPILQTAFGIVATIVKSTIDVITNVIQFFIGFVTEAWRLFGDNIVAVIKIAFDIIKTTVEVVLGIIRGIIQFITGLITGDWDKVLQGLRTIWDSVWKYIEGAIRITMDTIQLVIETVLDAIHLVWDTIWNAIGLIIDTVWTAIETTISTVIGSVQTAIETAWNAIKSLAETTWDAIKFAITTPIEAVVGILQGVWDDITGAVTTAWDSVKGLVSGAIDEIVGFIEGLPDRIKDFAGDVLSAATEIGSKILEGIKSGLSNTWGFVTDVADALMNGVKDAWNAFARAVNNFIPNQLGWGPLAIPLPDNPIPEWHARGAIITKETLAIVAEAGPEVIIPLTDQARALQLMNASGLTDLVLRAVKPEPGSVSTPTMVTAAAGEVIHIDEAHFHDSVDVNTLLTQAEFAMQGGRF